jgi:hypothetical protein
MTVLAKGETSFRVGMSIGRCPRFRQLGPGAELLRRAASPRKGVSWPWLVFVTTSSEAEPEGTPACVPPSPVALTG